MPSQKSITKVGHFKKKPAGLKLKLDDDLQFESHVLLARGGRYCPARKQAVEAPGFCSMHKRAAFLRSAQYEQVSRALPRNAQRATIVQRLIDATGVLDEAFDVFEVEPASARAMQLFHSREYVDALQKSRDARQRTDYGLVDDCSAFRSVFELASLEAGGSVQAAQLLGSGMYDSAIWWGGGRHHAKTDCAAGYCYVNDVVLAILELLKSFERVMYIDVSVLVVGMCDR